MARRRIRRARTKTEAIAQSLDRVHYMDAVEKAVLATGGRLKRYRPLR